MPGLLRGVARTAAIAGTATVVSNRVSRRQAGRWAAKDQQAQQEEEPAEAAPEPAQAAADPMDSKLDQLRQLGELKAQGVLSESEFATQKAKILGS
jgi:hypothetical protein